MKFIFRCLKYVFFRAFLWERERQDADWIAALIAMFYVTFLLLLWSLVVITAISDLVGTFIIKEGSEALIFGVFFILLFYILPYNVFAHKERYKKIIAEFSVMRETKKQARIRAIIIFINYPVAFLLTTILAVWHNLQ